MKKIVQRYTKNRNDTRLGDMQKAGTYSWLLPLQQKTMMHYFINNFEKNETF